MAPYHTVRPENVLKRAEELIAVGQPEAAHEILYELITSKKTRAVSPASLEPIALLFIDLSVQLRKGKIAKDGLHQYKKNVQLGSTGLQSVELVVRSFINSAETRLQEAIEQCQQQLSTLDADDDLEAVQSPETILLSAVSNDDSADRTERELVNPWLRFLWEAYRAVIDILRNNSRLEISYFDIVNKAFQFCLKYNRKTEFRRLCDLLRGHIQGAQVKSNSTNSIDLNNPKTVLRFLEIRFNQLNAAVTLQLWSESFRSVEDCHQLLSLAKTQNPNMMVNYYENLARIFAVSDNELFHAASWSKFFSLFQQSPTATDSDLTRYASILVLSALSIPYNSNSSSGDSGIDDSKNKNLKLSLLLNLNVVPTRESLINLIINKNVLSFVDPSIAKLYKVLEGSFHPLTIRNDLKEAFKYIEANKDLQVYIKPLTRVILIRLFENVSKIYETIKLEFLFKLASFDGEFKLSDHEIENLLVNTAKAGFISISIDHQSNTIDFHNKLFDYSATNFNLSSGNQDSNSIIHQKLSKLASTLLSTVKYVDPNHEANQKLARDNALKAAIEGMAKEQEAIDKRAEILVERKRKADAERIAKEEEAAKLKAERIASEKKAEEERREQEKVRRAQEKIEREKELIREREKKQLAEEINAKGIIKIDIDSLEDVDADKLRSMQVEQLAKDKREVEDRLKSVNKRMDHTERAFRRYELPLLEKDAELQKQKDLESYDDLKKKLIDNANKDHEKALALKNRFQKILPEYYSFRKDIELKNTAEFTRISNEAKANLEREKQLRKEQVVAKRRAEINAKREAEARAEADAKRKLDESERKANELARLKAELDAQKAKDAKLLEIQRQREAEIEAALSQRNKFSASSARPMSFASKIQRSKASPVTPPSPSPSPVAAQRPTPAPAAEEGKVLTFAEKMRLKREGRK